MKNKSILISAIAVIAALGIGYSLPKSKNPVVENHDEAKEISHHEENDAEEGEIKISDNDAAAVGIITGKATMGNGGEVRVLGRINSSPEAKTLFGVPVSGRVTQIFVAPGTNVAKGAPLFAILSADAAGVIAEAKAAGANANAAQKAYSSDTWLYQKGVISRRDLDNSRANSASLNAYAHAAQAKIAASGNPSANGTLIIRAPIAGVISNLPVSVGGFVAQGMVGGEITNANNNEAVFQITPALLNQVSLGARINIETTDGRQGQAIVKTIAPDETNNSAIIRARIQNIILPLGSVFYARIQSQTPNGVLKPMVPDNAIINTENGAVVFVKTAVGFKAVLVLVGNAANGRTEVINGLKGDEIIVVKNAFLLKSELAKGEVEHSH